MPDHHSRPRRGAALAFLSLAQLMIVLDSTVVNVAAPAIQSAFGIGDGERHWIVTAFGLGFGGLLLLGGKLADLWGRRRVLVAGLIGFSLASALSGAAVNMPMLMTSRALQGIFAALLSPAALSLIAALFTSPTARTRALGIYGAVGAAGGGAGLVLGGVFTQFASWRWTFLISPVVGAVAVAGVLTTVRVPEQPHSHARLDLPGAGLVAAALVTLVLGLTGGARHRWTAGTTMALFTASIVLLALFCLVESKVREPMVPLRLVAHRSRGGVLLSLGLGVSGQFGLLLALSYYLQSVKGYTPLMTGLAYLPMMAGMVLGSSRLGPVLTRRLQPRLTMGSGFLLAGAGLLLLSQVQPASPYSTVLLPGLLLLGTGIGTAFTAAVSTATHQVATEDSGVVSALVNTAQQVGAALGTAVLNALAARTAAAYASSHAPAGHSRVSEAEVHIHAVAHGCATAALWASAVLALAALIALVLIDARPNSRTAPRTPSGPGTLSRTGNVHRAAQHL
ncbi:MFS transporter [Streptomyces sp. PRKS01-29]|nr:MFS transporter [Streptomyces sabulosicollis]MBI0293325.1 MFS transporter [Streptomyces sabulosicollis]